MVHLRGPTPPTPRRLHPVDARNSGRALQPVFRPAALLYPCLGYDGRHADVVGLGEDRGQMRRLQSHSYGEWLWHKGSQRPVEVATAIAQAVAVTVPAYQGS